MKKKLLGLSLISVLFAAACSRSAQTYEDDRAGFLGIQSVEVEEKSNSSKTKDPARVNLSPDAKINDSKKK